MPGPIPPTVPTIDIAPFLTGKPGGKQRVAQAVRTANETIGFFAIVGHGVPDVDFNSAYDAARQFFDQTLEVKQQVKRPSPEASRGYNAVGRESLAQSLNVAAPHDMKETFAIGPVDLPADPDYAGPRSYPHFLPNVWPDSPPQLRTVWGNYFRTMHALSNDISQSAGTDLKTAILGRRATCAKAAPACARLISGLVANH